MSEAIVPSEALAELVPDLDGFASYRLTKPPDGATPPWIITTVANTGRDLSSAMLIASHVAEMEVRLAGLTDMQVDIAAMRLTDYITGGAPHADGFVFGSFMLYSDSGTYEAASTESPQVSPITGQQYSVRVLKWKVVWNRHG